MWPFKKKTLAEKMRLQQDRHLRDIRNSKSKAQKKREKLLESFRQDVFARCEERLLLSISLNQRREDGRRYFHYGGGEANGVHGKYIICHARYTSLQPEFSKDYESKVVSEWCKDKSFCEFNQSGPARRVWATIYFEIPSISKDSSKSGAMSVVEEDNG